MKTPFNLIYEKHKERTELMQTQAKPSPTAKQVKHQKFLIGWVYTNSLQTSYEQDSSYKYYFRKITQNNHKP